MKFQEDEKLINYWNTNFLYGADRYNVNLHVTDKNVYIDAKFAAGGLANAEGVIKFSKLDISKVEAYTAYWIFHRVKVILNNGEAYIFDRGLMPTSGIVNALNS